MFTATLDRKTRSNLAALIALILVAVVTSIPMVSSVLAGDSLSPMMAAFLAR